MGGQAVSGIGVNHGMFGSKKKKKRLPGDVDVTI